VREEHIESREYFSGERFFDEFLENISRGKLYQYTKKRINPYYTRPGNAEKIIGLIIRNMYLES